MREIKFRAWLDYGDGNGEMLPNIQNHINGKWAFGHIVNGSVKNVSAPMQHTGLKDKNGIDIYEGDICAHGNVNKVGEPCKGRKLAVVEFNSECGRFENAWNFYGVEVVGNIHENPGLLK